MKHWFSSRCGECKNPMGPPNKKARRGLWQMCTECWNSIPPDEKRCKTTTRQNTQCKKWTIGPDFDVCPIHEERKE